MFKLYKNKKCNMLAPVKGECIPIEKVPDKMFADKLLGDGVAFVFEGNELYAPCDGEIMMVATTKHAIGLKSKNGLEILIHIGLDTVSLNGAGFELLVKQGQKVKAKEKLIKVDQNFMRTNEMNLITPVVITNSNDYILSDRVIGLVDVGDAILSCKRK